MIPPVRLCHITYEIANASSHASSRIRPTFPLHAHTEAFHVATVLAAIPLALVNNTLLLIPTRVRQILTYRALEETFAALATVENEKVSRILTPLKTFVQT